MDSSQLLESLIEKNNLKTEEIYFLLNEFISGNINDAQMTAFLIALRMKGETSDEIIGLIAAMREHMITFPEIANAIDTCGTGGDKSGTFNISTTVAFAVAGAHVPVIKHGNKAASSKCGSADVLTQLGVNIMLTSDQAKKVFDRVGMIFLFAPLYHPATKRIVPIRKALGTRTVFNFLGPFLNPSFVKRQIIGVPNPDIAKKLAQVALRLGYEHLFIVSSESGMDEIDLSSKTTIYEIRDKNLLKQIIDPQELGFNKTLHSEILGGDSEENGKIIIDILNGKKGPRREIVILNSAYALLAADKVEKISDGITLAEKSIDSKAALHVLEKLITESKKYA